MQPLPPGFDSIQILTKPPKFYPALYFSVYDYWEIYDSANKYVPGIHDFKAVKGPLLYRWVLIEFSSDERYAVAYRTYTTEYLNKLAKLCPCHKCKSWLFRFIGIRNSCSCCVGCILDASLTNPNNVSEKFVKIVE